jgi:hypothetical protein
MNTSASFQQSLGPTLGARDPLSRSPGFQFLELAEYRRNWVHRRIETIDFIDDETVRRTVRVDFTVPQNAPLMPGDGKARLVPIAELQKKRHACFDICNHDGALLPMLTLTESSGLVSDGLIDVARRIAGRDIDPDVQKDLRLIAGGTRQEITSALARMHNATQLSDELRHGLYRRSRAFNTLIRRYSHLFLMVIPVVDDPGSRHILEFSYEEPFTKEGGFWAFLVGEPAVVTFDAPAAAEAESYHFEVSAPEGVKVTDGELTPTNTPGPSDYSHTFLSRLRLHVRNFPPGEGAQAKVSLLATRGTWFSSACMSACVIAAVLTAILFWSRSVKVPPRLEFASAGAAILLVLPSAFVQLLVRTTEHPLLAFLLRRIRALLILASLLAYGGAIALVVERSTTVIRWSWIGLASGGTLIALVLCASYWGPRWMRIRARVAVAIGVFCVWLALLMILAWPMYNLGRSIRLGVIVLLCTTVLVLLRWATLTQRAYVAQLHSRMTDALAETTRVPDEFG